MKGLIMKIEPNHAQVYQKFDTKSQPTKISFKADIPDEFISEMNEKTESGNHILDWVLGIAATATAGLAFFRNRKARIAKQIAENEKEIAKKTKTEAQKNLEKLKAEQEALDKQLNEMSEKMFGNHKPSMSAEQKNNNSSKNPFTGNDSGRNSINKTSQFIKINDHDKEYFENVKQELLKSIDASFMNKESKNSWIKTINMTIDTIINNNHSIEQKKQSVDMLKKEIAYQIEWASKWNNLEKQTANLKETIEFTAVKAKLKELASKKGFERILGYKTQKDFFTNKLLEPIKKHEDVPNIILMYGPKGTGKTLFAKAVANEGNINYTQIELTLSKQEDLQNLKNAALKSKEIYEKTGKNSIIHIDEIDGICYSDEYAEILKNLGKEFHATLIATTNHPKSVNTKIINTSKSEKIYMPTATKEDVANILQYVLNDFSVSNIDYGKLADDIMKQAKGAAYSNANIYNIAEKIVEQHYAKFMEDKLKYHMISSLDKITATEIKKVITENLRPDISKEILEQYKNIF